MSERKPEDASNTAGEPMEESAWEEWQLTAFVLGELEEPVQRRIAEQAKRDFALRSELKSIKSMLSEVKQVLRREASSGAADDDRGSGVGGFKTNSSRERRLQAIFARADQTEVGTREDPKEHAEAIGLVGASGEANSNRQTWLGVLAMSACLFVAGWLSIPAMTNWMAGEDGSGSVAQVPLNPSETPKEVEVDGAATESKPNEMATTEIPRPPSVAAEIPSELEEPFRSVAESDPMQQWIEIVESGASGMPVDPSAFVRTPEMAEVEPGTPLSEGDLLAGNPGGLGAAQGGVGAGAEMGLGGDGDSGGMYGAGDTGGDGSGVHGTGLENSIPLPRGAVGGVVQLEGVGRETRGRALGQFLDTAGGFRPNWRASELNFLRVREQELRRSLRSNHPLLLAVQYRIKELLAGAKTSGGTTGMDPMGNPVRSSGDRFEMIYENRFERVADFPLATFAVDVDTASFAKARQYLLQERQLPPADTVRIEEFVNYFNYEYAGPTKSSEPLGVSLALTECPWNPDHQIVRVGLQAEEFDFSERPRSNLVFLLDVSESMDAPHKLPLVRESMRMLMEQLNENDNVSIVVYAGAAGCILQPTKGDQQQAIRGALDVLRAGGSTNGGDGIQLAYDLAREAFIENGVNRVVLCTDGDFNLGVSSTTGLVELIEENAKSNVFLSVLGFGMENTNDELMEQISHRGNGTCCFIDSRRESHRQMMQQIDANLVTIAAGVQVQVEFNPRRVRSYRLLGYENRQMAEAEFKNDNMDAGEVGVGHRLTALFEVVPLDRKESNEDAFAKLRYGGLGELGGSEAASNAAFPYENEILAVKCRYKLPDAKENKLFVTPLKLALGDEAVAAERDLRWAAAMVEFGMLLRDSRYAGAASWIGLLERATDAAGLNPDADRQECLEMIRTAASLQ
ncbi:MAG: vWA domain-containing protein [Aureliella sp.]